MTQNQIKNLVVSIFCMIITGYALLINYSHIGLAVFAGTSGIIFLVAFVYGKRQSITEKIDIYALLVFAGVLAVSHIRFSDFFSAKLFLSAFADDLPKILSDAAVIIRVVILIAGFIAGAIFNSIGKSRNSAAAMVVNKYIGLFLRMLGITVFFLAGIDYELLTQYILIFAFFGMTAVCRYSRKVSPLASLTPSERVKEISRLSKISFLIALSVLLVRIFLPGFQITADSMTYNFTAYLNVVIFPWYSVLGISLLLIAFTGIGLRYGAYHIDEDSVFLAGLAGFVWVVKASVYFYFDFHWIAVGVYALILMGFINRFIKKKRDGKRTTVNSPIKDNEFYLIPVAAVCTVASIFLIHIGYVYLWLSLAIGMLVVVYGSKNAAKWGKDVVFWESLLFAVAGAACMISLQNGFSAKKLIIIAAIFVFTGVIMYMMNHKNDIGQNKFKKIKTVIVLVYALLVIIPAYKGGSGAEVEIAGGSKAGALIKEESDLIITASANGKNNSVEKFSYVWTDNFLYDKDSVIEMDDPSDVLQIKIAGRHLILWTEDYNGVISRKDCWFYDMPRRDASLNYVFSIGNPKTEIKTDPDSDPEDEEDTENYNGND